MYTGVPPSPLRQRFFSRPTTRLGWRAVGLGAAFVVLFLFNALVLMRVQSEAIWLRAIMILYGWTMLACGLGCGLYSLIAILRRGERSWMVWLPLLAGAWVVVMLVGELLLPH